MSSALPATDTRGAHSRVVAVRCTLYRKDIGIVGYGLISRETHRRLAGFGANVYCHHRTRYPNSIEKTL
ncbi:NAD(P)-dependent oxidoreductase [Sorangium sp. So ce295]|uniref:NAD(P)-dependent oxidoreductase n=1 Tax=Sorangium sp. So ce295 TaxID=3133295 RepID=UPI003F60A65E